MTRTAAAPWQSLQARRNPLHERGFPLSAGQAFFWRFPAAGTEDACTCSFRLKHCVALRTNAARLSEIQAADTDCIENSSRYKARKQLPHACRDPHGKAAPLQCIHKKPRNQQQLDQRRFSHVPASGQPSAIAGRAEASCCSRFARLLLIFKGRNHAVNKFLPDTFFDNLHTFTIVM